MWGCPVYVLSPTLQSGNKIPRWEPRSKRGVFCGLSTIRSSEVPQVLNLTTGSITTQFHVVFDDLFTTVAPVERESDPPSHWNDLRLEQTEFIPVDTPRPLSQEWLSETDIAQEGRAEVRTNRVREDLQTKTSASTQVERLFLPSPTSQPSPSSQTEGVVPPAQHSLYEPLAQSEGAEDSYEHEPIITARPSPETGLRRSSRKNKGQYASTR